MILTDAELEAIQKQAEAEYPAECCGVVLEREGSAPDRVVYPCRNVQDAWHARDPERFPRDARTAYHIDPQDILAFTRLADDEGYAVSVIYHSHVDVGAYFSETDRRDALLGDQPAYPGATYVVVAVNNGRAGEARAFRWEPAAGGFVEMPMVGDARGPRLSPEKR